MNQEMHLLKLDLLQFVVAIGAQIVKSKKKAFFFVERRQQLAGGRDTERKKLFFKEKHFSGALRIHQHGFSVLLKE